MSAPYAIGIALLLAGTATRVETGPPQGASWQVDGGEVVVICPLTIGGSFEAKTRSLAGRLSASANGERALDGELSVDLSSLDTGIGLRNTHLKERYLEVQRGDGYAHATITDVVLASSSALDGGRSEFTASFTVHGVTRPVRGSATLARGPGGIQVDATFPVTLPEHAIPKPRYLGVGVQDEVRVRVTFTAAPADGGGGQE